MICNQMVFYTFIITTSNVDLFFSCLPIRCCLGFLVYFCCVVFAVLAINILHLRCMHCTHTSLFYCVCCYCSSCLWHCIAFHFVCMPIIKPMGNHFFHSLSSFTSCEHAKKNFHTCVDCAIFLHPNEWKSSFNKKKYELEYHITKYY